MNTKHNSYTRQIATQKQTNNLITEKTLSIRSLTTVLIACLVVYLPCFSSAQAKVLGAKESVIQEIESSPGIALALPTSLPDGYRLMSFNTKIERGGQTVMRVADFAPALGKQGSVVSVCIEAPENSDEHYCQEAAPGGAVIQQVVDGLSAYILVIDKSDNAVEKKWRNLTLTTNLDAVTWLR